MENIFTSNRLVELVLLEEEPEPKGSSSSDEPKDENEDESNEEGEESDSEDSEDSDGSEDPDDASKADSKDSDDGSDEGDDGSDGEEEGEDSPTQAPDEPEDGDFASESDDEGSSDPMDGEIGKNAGSNPASPENGVFAELLDSAEKPNPLKDLSSAMAEALKEEESSEEVLAGEARYAPVSTQLDKIFRPTPEERHKKNAAKIRKAVGPEVSSLTSKLRTKFLQAKAPIVEHGVRKGAALSERRLVDSVIELRSGRRPTRPDWQRTVKDECSLAVALVLDESGSMSGIVGDVAKAAFAVAEPMSNLNSPCLVIGPRNFGEGFEYTNFYPSRGDNTPYHRTTPVVYDIFKDWDEKISLCWERFGCIQAGGSTPLEDGIQVAMKELNTRTERHRVIIVVTDGAPDSIPVVKRQIRVAKEAGIEVIGVGISYGCYQVKTLFPTHVAVENIKELPKALLDILDGILFPAKAKKLNLAS